MKKLIAIFVAIVFIPCFASAEADEYAAIHEAFAGQSIDDLLALKMLVEFELDYRGYKPETATKPKEVNVPVGKYTIGDDIPEGTYTIKHNGNVMSMVTIYNANGGMVTMYTVTPKAPIGKCVLEKGQSINIVGEPLVFTAYEGLGF